MEVSIGWDRGQEPSNRECPDHISAVGIMGTPSWHNGYPNVLIGRVAQTVIDILCSDLRWPRDNSMELSTEYQRTSTLEVRREVGGNGLFPD